MLDMFSSHPGAPRARLDGGGLVLLLPGSEIVAVRADTTR